MILLNCFRYVDGILVLNIDFNLNKKTFYPSFMILNKTNTNYNDANFLDFNIYINNCTTIDFYDRRKSLNFRIQNFPHLYSNLQQ